MLGKIIQSFFNQLDTQMFKPIGLVSSATYAQDSDSDTIAEKFTKDYNIALNLSNEELDKTTQELEDNLIHPISFYYKYSPIRLAKRGNIRSDFVINFGEQLPPILYKEWEDLKNIEVPEEDRFTLAGYQYVETFKTKRDPADGVNIDQIQDDLIARKAVNIEFDLDITMITTSTEIVNLFQILWLVDYHNKVNTIPVEIELLNNKKFILDFDIQASEILESGHIDYELYGDLQIVRISITISGIYVLPFAKKLNLLEKIDLELGVK